MRATWTGARAVLGILSCSLVAAFSANSHSADAEHLGSSQIISAANSAQESHRTVSGMWLAKCAGPPSDKITTPAFGIDTDRSEFSRGIGGDQDAGDVPDAVCVGLSYSTGPRIAIGGPCGTSRADLKVTRVATPCDAFDDRIAPELTALGKEGTKIERAREAVESILRGSNACTEWLRTKDANPGTTFHTLDFVIDRKGSQFIRESPVDGLTFLMRQPYVAQATQDGGAHTAITINAYGAFYRSQGNVERSTFRGGHLEATGPHYLTVGGYLGDTMVAQMVTLLHEFGHIINLLPEDADNLDGQSVRNTNEVVRHCRTEIEESAKSRQRGKR